MALSFEGVTIKVFSVSNTTDSPSLSLPATFVDAGTVMSSVVPSAGTNTTGASAGWGGRSPVSIVSRKLR